MFFFVALYSFSAVIKCLKDAHLTIATVNDISSAALFMSLASTVWTTALIVYRIYSASRHVLRGAKSRFYNIVEMITQSAIIYSFALVITAMLAVIPQNESNIFTIATTGFYASAFLNAIAVRRTRY